MPFHALARKSTSVIPEQEFRGVVETEKARARRYGAPLSIVEFSPVMQLKRGRAARHIRRMLFRRLRATDRVGWIQQGALLAAVLPDTDRAGATKLASELAERVRRTDPAISVAVDCYGGRD